MSDEMLIVFIKIVFVSYIISITITLLMIFCINLKERTDLREIPKLKKRSGT